MDFQAVTFDHGGVLVGHPSSFWTRRISQLLDVSEDEYLTAYFHHNKRPNLGEISWDELWPIVLDELGKSDKLPQMQRLDAEFRADRQPNQQMVRLVRSLRAAGYKTGLLSNYGAELIDELKNTGLYDLFDVAHVSGLTGFVKPDPQAFTYLADTLHVDIKKLIFIDDSPKSLSTATDCGYTPLLFESYEKLAADLRELGVDAEPGRE